MLRRLALAVLGIGALIVAFSAGGQIGFSVTSENGVEAVSAGTSPRALAAVVIMVIAFFVALEPDPAERPGRPAGTLRRGVASQPVISSGSSSGTARPWAIGCWAL